MVTMIQQLEQTGRQMRRPVHTFSVKHRPFEISPFMIAPVIPGETFKNALLQSRAVTDPLTNRLTGWWLEHYLFYVPHQALGDAVDDLENMMLDPSDANADLKTTIDSTWTYFQGGSSGHINWTQRCLEAITTEYFRAEGDDYNTAAGLVSSHPIAQVHGDSWLDSVFLRSAIPSGGEVPEDAGNVSYDQFSRLQALYELQRTMGLADMTYDDWLALYGVKLKKPEDPSRPELIRYSKDWTYPTNTVEPTTGVPSSACSWAISEHADDEAGPLEVAVLVGALGDRPKVYFSKQTGSAVALMDDAFSWFPALMNTEAAIGLKDLAGTDGPLAGNTGGNSYVVDIRDLLIYGDQFINYDMTSVTDRSLVALPTTALQKRYVASADMDALFTGSTAATRLVHQDGVVTLSILGRQQDMTKGSNARTFVG